MPACIKCGKVNADGTKFCIGCGTPLSVAATSPIKTVSPQQQSTDNPAQEGVSAPVVCSACQAPSTPGMKFCSRCGAVLNAMGLAPVASQVPSKIQCGSCGGYTEAGYRFCHLCGTPIVGAFGTDPTSLPTQPPPPSALPLQTAEPAMVGGPARRPPSGAISVLPAPASLNRSAMAATHAIEGAVVSEVRAGVRARLISVRRDGSDGDVHLISTDTFDIGRSAGYLMFADDPYLANRHCRLSLVPAAGSTTSPVWEVTPLDAINGVYARLRQVHQLEDGDRILFGKQLFVYDAVSQVERGLAPTVQHDVLMFGTPLRVPWGRLRQLTAAGVYRDIYFLYRPRYTLGREDGDLTFPDDEFMSRQHLALSFSSGHAQVQDLGSSNGSYVQVRTKLVLSHGDMLRVGDQLLRFEIG